MFFNINLMNSKTLSVPWRLANNQATSSDTTLPKVCSAIEKCLNVDFKEFQPLSLRTSAMLLNGAARMYRDESNNLYEDCVRCYQYIMKCKLPEKYQGDTSGNSSQSDIGIDEEQSESIPRDNISNIGSGDLQRSNLFEEDETSALEHGDEVGTDEEHIETITDSHTSNITSGDEQSITREDGIDEEQIEAGIDEEQIEAGIDEEQIEAGIDEEQIEAGIDEEQIEDGIDEEQIEAGIDEEQIEVGTDEEPIEAITEGGFLNSGSGDGQNITTNNNLQRDVVEEDNTSLDGHEAGNRGSSDVSPNYVNTRPRFSYRDRSSRKRRRQDISSIRCDKEMQTEKSFIRSMKERKMEFRRWNLDDTLPWSLTIAFDAQCNIPRKAMISNINLEEMKI